jgi:hypothetical protein
MIHKFCIRNSEDRCIQCRDYAPKKRVCPVYRIYKKQQQEKTDQQHDRPQPPKPLSCIITEIGKMTRWNVEELQRYLAVTTDTVFYIKTEAGEEVPMLVERLRHALALQKNALPRE